MYCLSERNNFHATVARGTSYIIFVSMKDLLIRQRRIYILCTISAVLMFADAIVPACGCWRWFTFLPPILYIIIMILSIKGMILTNQILKLWQ